MRAAFATLAFAASAYAYTVVSPNNATGWFTDGNNFVTWNRVNTDAANFSVVLTNQDRSILITDQIVLALVVPNGADTESALVGQPSGKFPPGDGYRVNLVKSPTEQNTIYAQSSEFTITVGNGTNTTSTGTVSVAPSTIVVGPTVGVTPAGSSGALNPSSTTDPGAGATNAASHMQAYSYGMGAVALLFGVALA